MRVLAEIPARTKAREHGAHAADLVRINRAADRLNLEAAEVLEYQAFDTTKPAE